MKTALCLSGGGARGFAHIGALKAFEEAGLSFDITVGTSAGSLAGALYAAGISAREAERYALCVDLKEVKSGVPFMPSDPYNIGKLVCRLTGDVSIERLAKKFAAVATDLRAAKLAVLDSGSLLASVSASCAVPFLFRPVVLGERILADGGIMNNVPADVCRMLGAEKVVTVDVHASRGRGAMSTGLFDTLKATFGIMMANASVTGLRLSDVVIAPDTAAYSVKDKEGRAALVKAGYEATKARIDEVYKVIGKSEV